MNQELIEIIFALTKEPIHSLCLRYYNNELCNKIYCPNCILSGRTTYILNLEQTCRGPSE